MNKLSFFKALLMKEMDEELIGGQKELDVAKPKGRITPADFAALRDKKRVNKEAAPVDPNAYGEDENLNMTLDPEIPEKGMTEGGDHEVSMANNSLESILKHAMELKAKLGNEEKDIPAWIQDHITNAANYISQAAENYHEYNEGGEHDMDELPDGTIEEPAGDAEDAEMTLKSMMEDLFEAKKKKPSAGLSKKKKSAIVKQAKKGKDFGKKGPGFQDIVKKAKASGAKDPEAVAGAAFWKSQAKKGK